MVQRYTAKVGIEEIDKLMEGEEGRSVAFVMVEKATTEEDAGFIFPYYVEYISRYYRIPYRPPETVQQYAINNLNFVLRTYSGEKDSIWKPTIKKAKEESQSRKSGKQIGKRE
jgi:hypothetical protein